MSDLVVDLQLIEKVQKALEQDSTAAGASQRRTLTEIYQRIRDALTNSSGPEKACADNLLPEYMKEHPETLTALREQAIQDVISYVSQMCDYYRKVKAHRPLTDEEKVLGRDLAILLRTTQDLL